MHWRGGSLPRWRGDSPCKLWHFLSTFLLPDAAGNTMSWMILPILGQHWDNITLYSWGSAVLAWLYRQLCEACRRTARDSNVGGCTYMLQIWIWERMPVGRPSRLRIDPWHRDDAHPIFYHVWKHVRPVRGNPDRRYRAYTNEFDVVTQHQIEWKPYDREQLRQIVFSPTIDRRKRYKENDWRVKHGQYLVITKVKPSRSNVPIEDAPSDSDVDIADAYDTVTRYGTQPERAPLHDNMGQQFARLSNEAGVVMEHAVGSGDGLLRQFAERVRKSCRRMAMRMNCMSSSDVHHGGNGQGTSSGSRRTPLATPPGLQHRPLLQVLAGDHEARNPHPLRQARTLKVSSLRMTTLHMVRNWRFPA
uniref:Aminotransferase-like plant mobile domain-containing protein n=1 Tax=Setaria italica TaxID=4555 RepID=K3YD48_SETIT